MSALLKLKAGNVELELAPKMGGAIASLNVNNRPVLRPWSGNVKAGPFALGCNIMVPFCNRIANGSFEFDGQKYEVSPNVAGELYPLHGDGFQREWTNGPQSENSVMLTLASGEIGPFHYAAEQEFSLTKTGLRVDLKMTNIGPQTLPFGCGFHPWFPRGEETRLAFGAQGVWQEDENYLPIEYASLSEAPQWDFTSKRALPQNWINKIWTGWNGFARIGQGPDAVSLTVSGSDLLHTALVYSPDPDYGFFCFEPMSHPTNALNMAGLPGLKLLAPGASLGCWMALDW